MIRINKELKKKLEFFCVKLYHLVFSEKFKKKINFNFNKAISRLDLINFLIKKNHYQKYLEIGCDNDQVFSKIKISKVGVDPVSGGNFRGTSDDFFRENSELFDCIFIDGLHVYSQVLRDIKNSIKILSLDGVILVHDCLPEKIYNQYVPRCTYKWKGDVWKAIVELRTYENLNIQTILIDEGIAVIKKKKNLDKLKINQRNFQNLKFEFFYHNYKNLMKTIDYEKFIKQ